MPAPDKPSHGITPRSYPAAAVSLGRLAARMDATEAGVCVGLDPVVEKLPPALAPLILSEGPAGAIERFCLELMDGLAPVAAAVKPQMACFERHGSAGYAALERVIARAKALGLWVIHDGKRGDIGLTAGHYAAAAKTLGADAATVNAYMGESAARPFLEAGLAVFVLVRTSNPDSGRVQSAAVSGDERDTAQAPRAASTVAERMATLVAHLAEPGERGLSPAGAVVGATNGPELARLRELMPDQVFLMPGVGAQGATPKGVAPARRAGSASAATGGLLIAASRSVLYPSDDPRWETRRWPDAIGAAAADLRDECRGLSGRSPG